MKITFLGTGTSQGVPMIACQCAVCLSEDKRDKRLRSSVLIESETTTIVIDTGPDFRYQMLREKVQKLDAVVYTHSHKDHIAGMDDIRAFNYAQDEAMDIYATTYTWEMIKKEFSYVFAKEKYPGIPIINEFSISEKEAFTIGDIHLQPILVWHYKMPVLGFRINNLTYITDANKIDDDELQKIIGSQYFIVNALRQYQHISHFSLPEAIKLAQEIKATKTYFTHISHILGKYEDVNPDLPHGIELAYDGLKFQF